jgi:peptide-methionine (S)-S-oxide reductase
MEDAMETAEFGAGCFWGVEVRFAQLPGVIETAVGYEGGQLDKPTYKDVCTDQTGHAEVVQVKFDPARVNYRQLLDLFFSLHDPTQLNRQGPDWGTQYRSVVFFHSPEQEAAAKETIERLTREKIFSRPIVTQVVPAQTFWRAEEYHQKYLEKRGAASCHI